MTDIREWIDLIEGKKEKPDDLAALQRKWAEDDAAEMEAGKYKRKFMELERDAQNEPDPGLARLVSHALMAGLENASDTPEAGFETPEYFRVALSSISMNEYFEDARVRDWFSSRGYEW
jgi:hypothetical protein